MDSINDIYELEIYSASHDTYFFKPTWEGKKILKTFRLHHTPLGVVNCYFKGDKNRAIANARLLIANSVAFESALKIMIDYETKLYFRDYLKSFESSKYSLRKMRQASVLIGIKMEF